MINNWINLFSDNIKNYGGYSIGKLFKLLDDPEIISLAGGLPSPDIFLKEETRIASHNRLEEDIETIMQYTSIPGEPLLINAVIDFMKRENIDISEENILITSSGQHGLDITGRLFLNPGDIVLLDRPTFAGAIVAFQLQNPTFVGVDIQDDGPNVKEYKEKIKELAKDNKNQNSYM
jgi:Transcriptional regulators containing a DNA-binding HTH domain and an aminotransferase domain (MocR family) and their eukaryotic orthologs